MGREKQGGVAEELEIVSRGRGTGWESKDANPWRDSRGMRLLQGQGGAMGVHSLRSSGAFTEEANQ